MTFAQPPWFWAFALFPIILVLFFGNEGRREKLIRQLVAARLHDRLAGSVSVAGRRWRMVVFLLGLACVIVSLAQPQWGYTWEQSQRKGRDVLIAIDCSRSMLATDLSPSRLGRAKLAAQDLINGLQGDRVGLIAFAGSAFLQAPLTVDYGAVLNSLTELDTNIIPRGGTDIASAIKQAVEAFGKGEGENRCLVIFTDGEELDENAISAAEEQKDKIKIFTVGLGSADGSLIPVAGSDGGTTFVKDENGQIVKSRLDEDRLRKIAEATGGFYVHLQSGPAEMQQIIRSGLGQMKEQDIDARMSRRPIERYQWPLAAGLTLLAISSLISERRRTNRRAKLPPAVTAAGLLCACFLGTNEIQAEPFKNPGVEAYQRGDETAQRGAELAEQKDQVAADAQIAAAQKEFGGAYQEFAKQLKQQPGSAELNFNLGAAAYKLGKVDEALLAFSKATLTEKPSLRVDAESNIASTLYRKGAEKLAEGAAKKQDVKKDTLKDWKDGLRHFDEALKVQPDNRQVQGHREFLRRKIEELEKEPPKQDQQKKDEQDQKKDQDKKDDQKDQKDQKNQQDQSKDGKKDDQKKQDPSQGQNKDQQQPDKGDGKPQDQPKDGSGKDQQSQQGKNDPSKQDQSGEGKDPKDAKNDPGKDDPAQKPQDGQGEPSKPAPDEGGKARDGQIGSQGNPQQSQEPQPADPQQEAAAEAQAAQEGRMTEAQAKALLESLKNDDQRVQLLKPGERRVMQRPMRDW